ncbi:MAG: hypothetical protein KKI02_05250, partial [Planctomycetes bacterium]|nr:hypothetical protein [Planctomycetota bacterium]
MKHRPSRDVSKPSRVLALAVLAGALLASVPAGCSAVQLWRRLPTQRVSRIEADELQIVFDQVNRAMPPEAREALALRQASRTLAGAMRGMVTPEELLPTMATAVNALNRSQVGRLQLAAARMWLLEQAGEPIESCWPSLRVFLEGMQHANLEHYQAALTRHWARAYQAAGLGPGTAYGLAEDLVGHEQGPFLQFLVPHLRRVIAERDAAGDTAAATACRSVLHSLLRHWVFEPGPAGLRLLAADLLAESLEADAGADQAAETQAIAQSLRRWRSTYHEAARGRPVATLDLHRKPALAPAAHERLVARVGLVTWLGSATLAAAIVALLCGWSWLGNRADERRGARWVLHTIGVVLIVTIGGLLWIHLRP